MYEQSEATAAWPEATTEGMDRRQFHIEGELAQTPQYLTGMFDVVKELEKRLHAVLRSDEVTADKTSEPHMPLVPLAETLRDHNNQLRALHLRLVHILDRLEL